MKQLGNIQRDVLGSLVRHKGYWYANCGWYWDTHSGTKRIMESLLKRGLVEKFTDAPRSEQYPMYTITQVGRKEAK